eukprot:TRINITY_DN1922_c0_g1_i1.p1 TRINITY_DN1922_c0_g1~~TRINITY_DN1922_c0_g1_i1.p1  ORF type:complete len:733 (-),score=259.02 TRINITY_DN1922_c0_g1_i1:115-2280(-)
MAIGVAGGFQVENAGWEFEKQHSIAVVHSAHEITRVPLSEVDAVPMSVSMAAHAIVDHQDGYVEEAVQEWEEKRAPSRYADALIQLPDPPPISQHPDSWACGCGCGLKQNLWLNLSDGYIGGGRKNWDGSGGCGGALEHFRATGQRYPLCAKLGTITAEGADVFSYAPDEDDMVLDPHLEKHLQHFGISMREMTKVDKTMAELEIEANMKFEWDALTEANATLKPLAGANFVGLKNLGNTCYVNSLLQLLFSLNSFRKQYLVSRDQVFSESPAAAPATDFETQMKKLARALLSDDYNGRVADDAEDPVDISPKMLKSIVGRDNPEYRGTEQQDVHAYYQHFLQILSLADRRRGGSTELARMFSFTLEERIESLDSGKVKYREQAGENTLCLSVPLECATNQDEVAAYESAVAAAADSSSVPEVLARVPFSALLEKYAAPGMIEYKDPESGRMGNATKATRLSTFPPYLFVQIRRYLQDDFGNAKKISASVPVPSELDLSSIRGSGPKEGEVLMKDEGPPEANAAFVDAILGMGFGDNAAKRACLATKNVGVEQAMEWIFAHMDDPDLNDPLPAPGGAAASGPPVNEESLAMLVSMGFSQRHSEQALRATDGDLERAAVWVMSHPEEAEPTPAPAASSGGEAAGGAAPSYDVADPCTYRLQGFASHMGSSVHCGHYVAHIRKDGKWVIFNDRKVAESENPPVDRGYLYLFVRTDVDLPSLSA